MMTETTTRRVSESDLEIGARIRGLREQRNLSQSDTARALGISFQQWQKYEQGRNRIAAARLINIAQLFETTPHKILGWSEQTKTKEYVCRPVDRKAAELWRTIQSQRARKALMMLMAEVQGKQDGS